MSGCGCEIEIKDQGGGFDWKAFRKNLKQPPDLTKESGRGLAILLASGSEIAFLDGGSCVVVARRQKKG